MPPRRARFSAVTAHLAALALFLFASSVLGQETVRVASYNIKFLSTCVQGQGNRLWNLQ